MDNTGLRPLNTFVISLHNPQRLLQQLETHNLPAIWFPGVDGQTVHRSVVLDNCTKVWSDFGPKSSIGIALSHLGLWKHFLNTITSEDDLLMVLEDDVVFVNDARKHIYTALAHTPRDFDILYLGCFGCQSTTSVFTTLMKLCGNTRRNCPHKINKWISKPSVALATHAYILSTKGARNLIANIDKKIFQHIDYCIQSLASRELLNSYVVTPRLAFQTSTWTKKSSNVSSMYPSVLNNPLSNLTIDTKVRASYLTTLSVFRIGDTGVHVTLSTCVIFLAALLLYGLGVDPLASTIWFVALSLRDANTYPKTVLFHYLVFMLPYLMNNGCVNNKNILLSISK